MGECIQFDRLSTGVSAARGPILRKMKVVSRNPLRKRLRQGLRAHHTQP
jgi:hypothetical protein